jgi:small subunit ribosomal protein S19e
MVNVRETPPSKLIHAVAEELKKSSIIKPHHLASYAKSGVCSERPPAQPDFWWIRSAAILRKVYLSPRPVGVQRLRNVYGTKKRRGHKPAHHRKAGGKFIRLMLQQLEKEGYIKKVDKPSKGRVITPKGQGLLDRISKRVG